MANWTFDFVFETSCAIASSKQIVQTAVTGKRKGNIRKLQLTSDEVLQFATRAFVPCVCGNGPTTNMSFTILSTARRVELLRRRNGQESPAKRTTARNSTRLPDAQKW